MLAGRLYGIPVAGTMGHSFVQCFADESEAFRAFARTYPERSILLVDTYDTLTGASRAIEVARELARSGSRLRGVRLDSGDLLELSGRVRKLFDDAGFRHVTIFASGGIDELEIDRLLAAGAPIDGFGVGSKLGVSADAPYLDMAYKLVAFDGTPTLKLSTGKATLPGAKQVWRCADDARRYDIVELDGAAVVGGEALLAEVMREGRRLAEDGLAEIRERARRSVAALSASVRALCAEPYDVRLGTRLAHLRARLERAAQERSLR
jgi:nicotinate phosphoribosyltransferase